MECNIMGCDKKVIKKPCYKTKYKNIVIVKLEKNVIHNTREIFERNNIKSFKQYCKQKGMKQINF